MQEPNGVPAEQRTLSNGQLPGGYSWPVAATSMPAASCHSGIREMSGPRFRMPAPRPARVACRRLEGSLLSCCPPACRQNRIRSSRIPIAAERSSHVRTCANRPPSSATRPRRRALHDSTQPQVLDAAGNQALLGGDPVSWRCPCFAAFRATGCSHDRGRADVRGVIAVARSSAHRQAAASRSRSSRA